jgi:hypothetical protein
VCFENRSKIRSPIDLITDSSIEYDDDDDDENKRWRTEKD